MKRWVGLLWAVLALATGLVLWREGLGKRAREIDRYRHLRERVFALENSGLNNIPAHQILFELNWIAGSTHDDSRMRARLDDLEAAINNPKNLTAKDEQSPQSGSWGRWYSEWFFKLDATYEAVSLLADHGQIPRYPVRILDRINSPEKLTAYLNSVLISDVAADGVNRRRELNESLADLMRLILRHEPANYPFDPGLKAALIDWLMNRARNPQTGYWGGWYKKGNRIEKTDDLSVTFHIISYLDGAVPDWPKIIDTTLAIKDRAYPLGWLNGGAYDNHNNMDVARIFELGWSQANAAQKEAIRAQIERMMNWCLHKSLQPEGSFAITDSDDSLETSIYFGATFLARLGYFDKSRRFWTKEDFPHAAEDRAHILAFIRLHESSGGEGGAYYRTALENLGALPFSTPKP